MKKTKDIIKTDNNLVKAEANRYFFINGVWGGIFTSKNDETGQTQQMQQSGNWDIPIITENNRHFSKKQIQDMVFGAIRNVNPMIVLKEFVIKGWHEFKNKKDYQQFMQIDAKELMPMMTVMPKNEKPS